MAEAQAPPEPGTYRPLRPHDAPPPKPIRPSDDFGFFSRLLGRRRHHIPCSLDALHRGDTGSDDDVAEAESGGTAGLEGGYAAETDEDDEDGAGRKCSDDDAAESARRNRRLTRVYRRRTTAEEEEIASNGSGGGSRPDDLDYSFHARFRLQRSLSTARSSDEAQVRQRDRDLDQLQLYVHATNERQREDGPRIVSAEYATRLLVTPLAEDATSATLRLTVADLLAQTAMRGVRLPPATANVFVIPVELRVTVGSLESGGLPSASVHVALETPEGPGGHPPVSRKTVNVDTPLDMSVPHQVVVFRASLLPDTLLHYAELACTAAAGASRVDDEQLVGRNTAADTVDVRGNSPLAEHVFCESFGARDTIVVGPEVPTGRVRMATDTWRRIVADFINSLDDFALLESARSTVTLRLDVAPLATPLTGPGPISVAARRAEFPVRLRLDYIYPGSSGAFVARK
jgi:hypothetical protein